MEDRPDELPKPPRRTAARPFFSPRPEGTTGPIELTRRRAAQLFTPPGSSPATPVADKADAPSLDSPNIAEEDAAPSSAPSAAADGAPEMFGSSAHPTIEPASEMGNAEFEGDWTAAPLISPERTLDAESLLSTSSEGDEDRLVVEQFEPEEIELTASASHVPDEHAIEVIAYDDANSLLQAAAAHGANPEVDGMELETTEFSFEQAAPPPRVDIDSFWATEPFAAHEPQPAASSAAAADETEATIDEETAAEAEIQSAHAAAEPSIDEQPLEWSDDPSTTISHAQAALEPEPEHDPAPEPEHVSKLADISPPWMSRLTPASTQALEQLKEEEPWDLTPARGIELIDDEEAHLTHGAESLASVSAGGHDVADALERIAARVRDGELDVPAGAELSDEAALSAVLTALLRMRR